jgi:hypothetical protein
MREKYWCPVVADLAGSKQESNHEDGLELIFEN